MAEANPLKKFWQFLFRDEAFRERMHFFRQVFLFRGLSDHSLTILVHAMVEKTYSEGETVFLEGDVGRAFFVVYEGRVGLYKSGAEAPAPRATLESAGPAEPVADLGPGDFFGEMALLDELPRSATAKTLGPARLYILYKTGFDGLIADAPVVASTILHTLARLLSARLRRQSQAAVPERSVSTLHVT